MKNDLQIRLSALQFIQYFMWGSWFVTAGNYWLNVLQYHGSQVGLLYGSTAIAASATPFLTGLLADKVFATEKLIGSFNLLCAALMYLLCSSTEFAQTYFFAIVYMMCFVPTFSLSNALCFYHIKEAKKNFPRIRVWGTIAWILAGLTIGLLGLEDTTTPFYISICCSVIGAFYAFTLPSTPPTISKGESLFAIWKGEEVQKLLSENNFKVLIICVGLITIPSSYYYSFVNAFLNEIGVENAAGKMALGQLTEIGMMIMLPILFTKWSLKRIMFIGLLTWGARYLLFPLGIVTDLELWHVIALALHGVAFTLASFAAQIYIDERVPSSLRATAQGFYSLLTMGLMGLIGTLLAGYTVDKFSISSSKHDWISIWMIPAIVGILVSICFWVLFKKEKPQSFT